MKRCIPLLKGCPLAYSLRFMHRDVYRFNGITTLTDTAYRFVTLTVFLLVLLYRALECDQFGRTCDLISQWCDKKKGLRSHQCNQPFKGKKESLCDSESLPVVQQQTHIKPISWSKPIRDREGWTPPSDWPWSRYSCTRVYV